MKRVLMGVMILGICGVVGVFVGYRGLTKRPPAAVDVVSENASVSIGRVQQEATRNGLTEWRLDAASAKLIDGGGEAVFEDPEITFFIEDQPPVQLTARQGTVKTDTQNIDLKGDVVVSNSDYILITESLHYLHQERAFSSQTPVDILNGRFTLKADAVRVDMTDKRALFSGNVRGVLLEGFRL